MIKLRIILMLLCCLSYFKLQAQGVKYSNEFLSLGVGGRALGIGAANASLQRDVSAGYWNPAGLAGQLSKLELSIMHASYYGNIANYDYVGIASPIDSLKSFGLTILRMGVDDIPDTRFLIDENGTINYDNVQSFAEASYAFMGSYGQITRLKYKVLDTVSGEKIEKYYPFRIGGNVKIIHRSAGIFAKAWGFGIDLGLQGEIGKWSWGLMARDISGTFNAWKYNTDALSDIYQQTDNVIPVNSTEVTVPRLQWGLHRTWGKVENWSVMAAFGMEWTFDGKRNTLIKSSVTSISPALGTEVSFRKLVYARAGIGNFQQITQLEGGKSWTLQPNAGLGFVLRQFSIDYALSKSGAQEGIPFTHIFSLKIALSQKDLDFLKTNAR